jgi:hypothetical protein
MGLTIIVLAVVAAFCCGGWWRERRQHNESVRLFVAAIRDLTGPRPPRGRPKLRVIEGRGSDLAYNRAHATRSA